jgi:antitoxin HicB
MFYKIPLVFTPQPEGGYTVTSPLLPELVTEGDSLDEALENVKDALAAIIEIYQDLGRSLSLEFSIKKRIMQYRRIIGG